MSDQPSPRRFHLRCILFAVITLAPLFIVGFTLWSPKQIFPSSDLKWVLGVCLLFSLLGFAANRLISIKFLGGEARLAEMKTARDEAAASVDEMKELKKNLQNAATTLARQQALSVMKSNRVVGDDFLTERIRAVAELKGTLDELGVPDGKVGLILDAVTPYVHRDLNLDAICAVSDAYNKNPKNLTSAGPDLRYIETELYDKFLNEYIVGETAGQVEDFLTKYEIEVTDAIRTAFRRLDAFLSKGRYLDLDGNAVITFPNPRA